MAIINLHINGKEEAIDIDPSTPLLYALRNNLSLNGPKFGCGIERCGSCMVLMDGVAMPSCVRPCDSFEKMKITTLEGLGDPTKLHPVQEAFIEEQAAQCGYCLNGMIMSASALLEKNPEPDEHEIKIALQRVLCRCGTHARMIRAVKRASKKIKRL
ncbi:(2Fe-2S)-binding protein [Olivibacter sp. SDN3]|uniref:(2Fe-2S)-binding protein n=1 Tax=Olivibacter sp. SDN3 TaxID=2764720 RepID=UPI0016517151|nr:(2Fe-2S)-binding protein [Olivibacter sp. SDN3]QNL50930.1 (2Fe-2S)-binding protein [Olivibacter sp. SDN3]